MTVYEMYTSGIQKQNRGHFANIVKIAKADNKVTKEEEELLIQMAKNLNLSTENFEKILENPYSFPINPPSNLEDRIIRLFGLTLMVLADGDVAKEEISLMHKIAVGLGFSSTKIEKICRRAIELVAIKVNQEIFIDEIKRMNRSKI